ncbi:hypothetical protein [Lacicoccus alkaliphilus]|uniref:Uncharacterized protein n=1 Tax=Lacicoccus alkaliphilus DSM 16010 TaxID=1123231 RepID=A0A1M7H694_9BACL|nr:hypothetical protein [Salinicoccus alkaliphilus]SHM24121.1 hypothetical protein SAMN02745189_01806 [Salinicoccus alkaliphilus DSM 16010]
MENVMKDLYRAITTDKRLKASSINFNEEKYKVNGKFTVFLSFNESNSKAYVVRGQAEAFVDALNEALETYRSEKPLVFKPDHLKLEVVTRIIPFKNKKNFDIENDTLLFNKGVDGLAFDRDLDKSFTPLEITGYNIVSDRKIDAKNMNNAIKQKWDDISFNEIGTPIKFRTETFYTNGKDFHELTRGHRIFKNIEKDDILEAILLTKNNYFKHVVNKRGKFVYTYDPAEDTAEKKYNILRHAGTIFSMLQTYELTQDEEIMEDIKKALEYLIDKVKDPVVDEKGKVVVERDVVKVGGNGLAIVALATYTEITQDKKYLSLMQELAVWIKEMQDETGNFKVHKQIYSTGEITDFVSDFYIGEAILAMTKLYALDNNEEWLDVAEKAADYLILNKNEGATKSTIHHDHWLLYGLKGLYRLRKKDIYIRHLLMMSDSIIDTQYTENNIEDMEFIGGYPPQAGTLPKSVPVACRTEGLSNAYAIAKEFGYEAEAERMKNAIILGVQFQLQMQLREESTMHFQNKSLSLGAFYNKFKDITLRNDFTQHNISACIACYKIMESSSQ